jgi:hypothetical protein
MLGVLQEVEQRTKTALKFDDAAGDGRHEAPGRGSPAILPRAAWRPSAFGGDRITIVPNNLKERHAHV